MRSIIATGGWLRCSIGATNPGCRTRRDAALVSISSNPTSASFPRARPPQKQRASLSISREIARDERSTYRERDRARDRSNGGNNLAGDVGSRTMPEGTSGTKVTHFRHEGPRHESGRARSRSNFRSRPAGCRRAENFGSYAGGRGTRSVAPAHRK